MHQINNTVRGMLVIFRVVMHLRKSERVWTVCPTDQNHRNDRLLTGLYFHTNSPPPPKTGKNKQKTCVPKLNLFNFKHSTTKYLKWYFFPNPALVAPLVEGSESIAFILRCCFFCNNLTFDGTFQEWKTSVKWPTFDRFDGPLDTQYGKIDMKIVNLQFFSALLEGQVVSNRATRWVGKMQNLNCTFSGCFVFSSRTVKALEAKKEFFCKLHYFENS